MKRQLFQCTFTRRETKLLRKNPINYIKKHWGNQISSWGQETLQAEAYNMVLIHGECTRMATEDLSVYTINMARILGVKQLLSGCEAPVMDRKIGNTPSNKIHLIFR